LNRNKSIAWFTSLTLVAFLLLLLGNKDKPQNKDITDEYFLLKTEQTNLFLTNLKAEGLVLLDSLSHQETYKKNLKNWRFYRYIGNELTHWSSNEWSPDTICFNFTTPVLFHHQSGWDLVLNNSEAGVLVSHPLVRDIQGSFEFQNYIRPLRNLGFELIEKKNDFGVWEGQAYISYYGTTNTPGKSGIFYLLAQLLLITSVIVAFYRWPPGIWIGLIAVILVRYLSYKGFFFNGLSGYNLFDPMVFASSQWVPSLGDLILHLIVAGLALFTLKKYINIIPLRRKWMQFIFLGFTIILSLFLADLIHSLVGSLVMNSNISFDVTNLSSLSNYTLIAATTVFAMLWMYYVLLQTLWSRLKETDFAIFIQITVAILSSVAFVLFQHFDASRTISGLLPSLVFAALSIASVAFRFQQGQVYRHLVYMALASLFFAQAVFENQLKREGEYLEHYATKLISNKDLETEYLFREMENSLAEEFLQPDDFQSLAEKKDIFEKRLRRLYFSGYLDRYNLLVLSFDSIGRNINSSTRYSYDDLNDLYNFQAFPTLSNHFYQVKSTDIFNGYLAKFENCDLNGHYGNIFILLEPKFIQSSYEYPQLVQKQREGKIINLENYSYAVYYRGRLMHQKGSFSYNLSIDTNQFSQDLKRGQTSNYFHFFSRQEENSIIILSHPDTHLVAALSTFSFSFIIFALILFILSLTWWALMFIRERYLKNNSSSDRYQSYRFQRLKALKELGLEQVLLSTRIRVSMVSLVLVGLLISVYVTIEFIRINDKQRSESELMYKIREVANQLQNEVDMERKLNQPEARQLIVNEIGDIFKVEASLFNAKGFLLASSVEDLYKQGIQAPLMDPVALVKLSLDQSSQILQSERIRNVEYTAAYIPIFNDKRQTIAYLNLPYFSQQNELDQEISSYTTTFVNLYLFLMILAFILAFVVSQRISKPLKIIREKMYTTGFGSSNELIEWRQNDEIGRLVQQYNKMVVQLAESAEKLSSSEREGAWKEMARQVAHEIKNPLTPMKLNIQHLQRAWADDSDKLEDTFHRVTSVLIEQIDGLSHLAGEFSNFANMPVDNFETCNISESLLNTLVLFEKTENIFFQYDHDLPEIVILADKKQLNRIFGNVLKNAIQSIPSDRKGHVKVDVTIGQKEVAVAISDNGKGIPKEDRTKIFVPNFSTKTSGMGLGLAMTRKMMEASNGTIRFETKLNEGTTFYLTWPLV